MKFEIIVELKPNVFNVEAKQVLSSIQSCGYNVSSINTGKIFTLEIPNSEPHPQDTAQKIALDILSNSVIEKFSIRHIND